MSFDRLVRAVDAWAGATRREDVFAQVGPSHYRPRHVEFTRFMNPLQYQDCIAMADAIVAHAGMGTIIAAVEAGKPILVMPRRGDLHETRNDHQVATARQFAKRGVLRVAMDEQALIQELATIDEWRTDGLFAPTGVNACGVAQDFIRGLRAFVAEDPVRPIPAINA